MLGESICCACWFMVVLGKLPLGLPQLWGAHNFVCKPLIEVRYKKKVIALVKSFPTICGTPPTHKEIGAIPNFL